ncbi:helix-turn-helix domain-containing protein [Aeromicrobium alkaliterrae]|uniref:HTH cro/C1-type domain-containing protein n=1 Tax=Aeromicrobium alkaliterrae TaxID=302168 RepID=A0ABN2JFC9_9ACTN
MPTTPWSDVRARRAIDESTVALETTRIHDEQRAYRLRELREELGITQRELATRLSVTQPTISALEAGRLDRSGLATLVAYVQALGGTVEVTATFGDRRLVLTSTD